MLIREVNVVELKELLSSGKAIVLVDVRTQAEIIQEGKIDGAAHIDIYAADFQERIFALDKTMTYVVYCKAGARSASACAFMQTVGIANVVNLQGGYMAYQKYAQTISA